jgi:hypothetical protein
MGLRPRPLCISHVLLWITRCHFSELNPSITSTTVLRKSFLSGGSTPPPASCVFLHGNSLQRRPSFQSFLRASVACSLSPQLQAPPVSNSVESAGTFGFDSCSCVSVRYDSANYPLLSMSLPLYHELLSATGWTMPTSSPVSRGMNVKAVTSPAVNHYFHLIPLRLIRAQIRIFSLWKPRGLCYLLKSLVR